MRRLLLVLLVLSGTACGGVQPAPFNASSQELDQRHCTSGQDCASGVCAANGRCG